MDREAGATGLERDAAAVQASAAAFLTELHAAMEALQSEGPKHPSVAELFYRVRARLEEALSMEHRLEVHLGAVRTVNGRAIPTAGMPPRALPFLEAGLAGLGAQGFIVLEGIVREEIEGFAARLLVPRAKGRSPEENDGKLLGFTHLVLVPLPRPTSTAGGDGRATTTAPLDALQIGQGLRAAATEAIGSLRRGGSLEVRPAFRAVTSLVDSLSREDRPVLAMAGLRGEGEYLTGHMARVSVLSAALGQTIDLDRQSLAHLALAALFADIGMSLVPPEVLGKKGRLTVEEERTIMAHTVQGARLILRGGPPSEASARCALVALTHHPEYPRAPSSGRDLYAAIVAIADAYDAMVSPRPHACRRTPREALEEILSDLGRDRVLARLFTNLIGYHPPGTLVRFQEGTVAVSIGRAPSSRLDRPVVRLLLDATGAPATPVTLDLADRGPDGRYLRSVRAVVEPEPDLRPVELAAVL